MRLISAEALLNLVRIKESTEGRNTAQKIRRLLIPMEFTRLDGLIEVIFATAKDVEMTAQADGGSTDPATLDEKREQIVAGLARRLGVNLTRCGRAVRYWDSAHERRVAVTISRRYPGKGQVAAYYWYDCHPQSNDFLAEGKESYLVLGCVDKDVTFALPLPILQAQLPKLNARVKPNGGVDCWFMMLQEDDGGSIALRLPKSGELLSLAPYEVALGNHGG